MVEIENFEEFKNIIKLSKKIPIVIDFYADWCMPCKILSPIIDRLENELNGKVKFFKINVEKFPEIAMEFRIMSVPTLVLIKDGIEVDRIIGFIPENKLLNWLRENKI